MPSLAAVRAVNASVLANASPTAVVIGGTSGIGENIALALASMCKAPHVLISGRKRASAERVLQTMHQLNPRGRYEFAACDVSRMRNVAALARELTEGPQKLEKINMLVLTAGILSMQGRTETEEGIDVKMATHFYGRFYATRLLLPLLESAASRGEEARVLSVLGAGKGAAPVPLDDLDLRSGFSLKAAGDAATQYNDLMAEEFSRRHPSVAFVSSYPGTVRTPIFDSLPWCARGPLKLLAPLLAKSPEDCGHFMTYALAAPEYSKGWSLVGEAGEAVNKTRYHTDEAREVVWKHAVELTERAATGN